MALPDAPDATAFVGGDNVPNDAGQGMPAVSAPAPSIPSTGGAPIAQAFPMPGISLPPAPAPSGPLPALPSSSDAEIAALRAQMQPVQHSTLQRLIGSVLPLIAGAAYAQQNNGSLGPFMQSFQQGQQQQAQQRDLDAQRQERLATAIRQLQWEQEQRQRQAEIDRRATQAEALATQRLNQQAAKEAADRKHQAMADTWGSLKDSGFVNKLNDWQANGTDVNAYLQQTAPQSLADYGLTMKDVVDRYAVKGPDGLYTGETKTPKEQMIGTPEENIARGRRMAIEANGGQALTDAQQADADAASRQAYAAAPKNPEMDALEKHLKTQQVAINDARFKQIIAETGRVQAETGKLGKEAGSKSVTPVYIKDAQGTVHAMVYSRDAKGNIQAEEAPALPGVPVQKGAMSDSFLNTVKGWFGGTVPHGGTGTADDPFSLK